MGKWSKLKTRYPKAPVDGAYEEKIDVVLTTKTEYGVPPKQLNDDHLAELYQKARRTKDELDQQVAIIDLEIEAYEREFIQRFEGRGQTTVTFGNGMRLFLNDDPTFEVDDDAFYAWRDADDANVAEFPARVMPQTLASRLKLRLEQGDENLPPGVKVGWIRTKLGCQGRTKEKR